MAISDDVRHTESRRARPLLRRNKVTTVLPRASPYPSGDKTGASEFSAQLHIYELTARLRRAVSPTRVSMKTKNPFRLYLDFTLLYFT